MKPENWTDYEHPCFDNYNPEFTLTRDELIEEAENIEDCHEIDWTVCEHLKQGRGWFDCTSGRLSRHCDWLPKEGTDG